MGPRGGSLPRLRGLEPDGLGHLALDRSPERDPGRPAGRDVDCGEMSPDIQEESPPVRMPGQRGVGSVGRKSFLPIPVQPPQ